MDRYIKLVIQLRGGNEYCKGRIGRSNYRSFKSAAKEAPKEVLEDDIDSSSDSKASDDSEDSNSNDFELFFNS